MFWIVYVYHMFLDLVQSRMRELICVMWVLEIFYQFHVQAAKQVLDFNSINSSLY